MVWVIRRFFARNGAQLAASMKPLVPPGVSAVVVDER
jgi:hypothetical protein